MLGLKLIPVNKVGPGRQLLRHDDVINWKHFPRYWPFVQGIHRSPVNSPNKGQWRRALMFSLISACTNSWANNGNASDLRRHGAHYDITVMERVCNAEKYLMGVRHHEKENRPDGCVNRQHYDRRGPPMSSMLGLLTGTRRNGEHFANDIFKNIMLKDTFDQNLT